MNAETMIVPFKNKIDKIRLSDFIISSSGTDFTYIQRGEESMRVRVEQLWFWTDEWQERHEAAIADLNEGRYTVYKTGDGFLTAMSEAIANNEARNS
jgi:hypothetical protein